MSDPVRPLRGFQDPETRRKAAAARAAGGGGSKKRERTPGPRTAPVWPVGLTRSKVNAAMYAAVVMADAGAAVLVPTWWVTPLDRLNEDERKLLAQAFGDELAKHPRALRFIAEITKYGSKAGLLGAVIIIAIPRMYRRGLIPEFLVPILNSMATGAQEVEREQQPTEPATPDGTTAEDEPKRDAA